MKANLTSRLDGFDSADLLLGLEDLVLAVNWKGLKFP